MLSKLSKYPVNKTPDKGIVNSNENTSTAFLSSPTTQFYNKEGPDNIDLPNSGSKALHSVQLFGKNEYHQNNPTSSRVLNSSPSFPPIQRKGSTNHSPKTAGAANKTGLPDNVKSGVEQLSGVSLSDVKVHYNSPKPAQLQAHAYAQGTDIHVASGQEKHVPHEAWHVVQQKQGRVQATKQMKGEVPVNDDAGLENEADVMGAKAVRMAAKENGGVVQQVSASNKAVAQLGMFDWMKSMYKGAKRMLGFGGKEKKDEKVGVSPTDVDVIPEAKENKHNLISLSKNPERFNKEEKKKILDSKTNAKKDLEIIPNGKIEAIKNLGKKRDKEGETIDDKEKGSLEKLLLKNIERNKLIGVKGGQGRAAELSGADKVQDHLGLKDSDSKDEILNIGNVKKAANLIDKKVSDEGIRKETFKESLEVLDSRLNKFLMFDNSASKSVLLKSGEGSLSDEEKWNIIQINSEFMSFIKEGLSINKIIPDNSVQTIIQVGKMDAKFDNALGGSVADSTNYDDGLRGNEAISNFGLDYSGYEEISENPDGTKSTSKLEGSKKVDEYGQWGALPTYVKEVGRDKEGHRKIKAVQNVFYVNVKLNKQEAENVRVPIHQNIIDYANEMEEKMMNNPKSADLQKLNILKKFKKRAASVAAMTLSTLSDGVSKNTEDPLTNLGMTRAGSRLITNFGTINQEYHMNGNYIKVKADSGLWLKDSTGKDTQVATCEDVQGKILFKVIDDQSDKLNAALIENKNFLNS